MVTYIMLYLVASVFWAPFAFILCKSLESAVLAIPTWPLSIPIILTKGVLESVREGRRMNEIEDKRRENERFKRLMEEERMVDKYLEQDYEYLEQDYE